MPGLECGAVNGALDGDELGLVVVDFPEEDISSLCAEVGVLDGNAVE